MSTPNTEPLVTDEQIESYWEKQDQEWADNPDLYDGMDQVDIAETCTTEGMKHIRSIYETHRKEWEAERSEIIRQRQWISVEERLPEKRKMIIGREKSGRVIQMYYGPAEWTDTLDFHAVPFGTHPSGHYPAVDVTHWMPLPEPPPQQR